MELRRRPLLFVDDLARPQLSDADHHHFERVLRVAPGDPITLGDGLGRWREARFGRVPEPLSEIGGPVPLLDPVTVAFSPVKGERPEWFVQKLTELGVDEIVPVVCERSVVVWDDGRAAKNLERMTKVAREACLQSRRLHLPRVSPSVPVTTFVADRSADGGVVMADPDGGPMAVDHRVVVVGPEGGFTTQERSLAPAVALPGHILRADTAAIVAGTVACGLRAGSFLPSART